MYENFWDVWRKMRTFGNAFSNHRCTPIKGMRGDKRKEDFRGKANCSKEKPLAVFLCGYRVLSVELFNCKGKKRARKPCRYRQADNFCLHTTKRQEQCKKAAPVFRIALSKLHPSRRICMAIFISPLVAEYLSRYETGMPNRAVPAILPVPSWIFHPARNACSRRARPW